MSKVVDFLKLPDVESMEEEIFVSQRLGTMKIKPMTVEQHQEYSKRSQGKIGKDGTTFDSAKFNSLIVANQVVEPNFGDAKLLESAKCVTATEFINKKLLSGEVSEIAQRICSLSGFGVDINDKVEEAKN